MEKGPDFLLPPRSSLDHNEWTNWWYYRVGVNPIPVVSKLKTGKRGYDWKRWQTKSIPEDVFNTWKQKNNMHIQTA